MRSSDPAGFSDALKALERDIKQANPGQRDRVAYLRAYSLMAYQRQLARGIAESAALLERAGDVNTRFRAALLVTNGHAVSRNFSEGLRYLDRAMGMQGKVTDRDLRVDGLATAAVLYNQLGQYRLGLRYSEEVLLGEARPRARCIASYLNLEARQGLGLLPSADRDILAAIDLCAGAREPFATNFTRVVLARKWADEGKTQGAILLLQRHVAEVEAIRYPGLSGLTHSLLAELLLKENRLEAAESHANTAIAEGRALPNSLPLVMAYTVLYQIAERRRDPSAALKYYKAYAEADKAYLDDVKARELAYQIARQENAQKTQQIELLDRQNQVLMLQQRLDKQDAANNQLTIALLVLAIGSVGFWAYRTKRVQVSLRRMADTDMLTGVSNRRHFSYGASQTLARCARDGEPAALIMFDLDHFKSINDRFGHDTGDWVLRQVASTCLQFRRSVDRFGRLGGEEFAFLLHGCDRAAAVRLADDCRVRLAQIDTRQSGHGFRITASFGVTSTMESGHELVRLLSHADRMLYRAKAEGRNRVAAFTPAYQEARQAAAPVDLHVVEPGLPADPAAPQHAPHGRAAAPALTLVDTHVDRVGTSG